MLELKIEVAKEADAEGRGLRRCEGRVELELEWKGKGGAKL